MKLLAYVNPPEQTLVPAVDVEITRAEIALLIEDLTYLRAAPNTDGGAHIHFEPEGVDTGLSFSLAPGESRATPAEPEE